jgi:hypothetical protein
MEGGALNRKKAVGAVVGMAAVAAIAFAVAYLYRDPINESAFARIREGMTEAEVVEVLGRRCDEDLPNQVRHWGRLQWADSGFSRRWDGRISIYVNFNEGGIVTTSFYLEREKTTFQRIRQWLGLDAEPTYRIHGGVGPASSSI